MLYVEHHWFLIIHCVLCIELHWKPAGRFHRVEGVAALWKVAILAKIPKIDLLLRTTFFKITKAPPAIAMQKSYNVCRFENKIPSSVDQIVLCKGSSYQLIRDQEKCLLLKTALGLFSWTSCFTLIRGSLWLTLVIVALELDYQSEKCQIMAMSIWCPMMTSSMMTVQKGQ